MQIGVYGDLRNPPPWQRAWDSHYRALLERYEWVEELGLAGLWVTEHHFWEDGYCPQPLTFLSAVAARTSRMALGTAVTIAGLRPAVDIAEQAAMVDVISGGRMQLGLGAGYAEDEFTAFGGSVERRFQTLAARVREIRELWGSGRVTPPPIQERMPIWFGAMGLKGARTAGRLGEGLLWLDAGSFAAYQEGLSEAGHEPSAGRLIGPAHMIIARDPERTWSQIAPHLRYHLQSYGAIASDAGAWTGAGSLTASARIEVESFRSAGPAMQMPAFDVVTPDDAVARLTAWLGDLPVEQVFFWDSIAGMPETCVSEHLELLAAEVAPRVAHVGRVAAPRQPTTTAADIAG